MYILYFILHLYLRLNLFGLAEDPTKKLVHENYRQYVRSADENIYFTTVEPFFDEWQADFNKTEYRNTPAPLHAWMKCVDMELRIYFFLEDTRKKPGHGKEASMAVAFSFEHLLKFYLYGEAHKPKLWFGGGNIIMQLKEHKHNHHHNEYAYIYINKWRHHITFPLNLCIASPKDLPSKGLQYVMSVYTPHYTNPGRNNKLAIQNTVNHFLYHWCALKLSQYELTVQAEQVAHYMANPVIENAVKKGLFQFYVVNPFVPGPMRWNEGYADENSKDRTCYWQQITQNLALLRRWKEPTRMYLWDADEYMTYHKDFTVNDFKTLITKHESLAFQRYMAFCNRCRDEKDNFIPEVLTLDFNAHDYRKNWRLNDPKLLVDPTSAGCYIIHWNGCGPTTVSANETYAFIAHFENMYTERWKRTADELDKDIRIDNSTYPVWSYCNPANFLKQPNYEKFYFPDL